jgi:hypothetical protein
MPIRQVSLPVHICYEIRTRLNDCLDRNDAAGNQRLENQKSDRQRKRQRVPEEGHARLCPAVEAENGGKQHWESRRGPRWRYNPNDTYRLAGLTSR